MTKFEILQLALMGTNALSWAELNPDSVEDTPAGLPQFSMPANQLHIEIVKLLSDRTDLKEEF